ncbi:MAG: hypothetical protein LBJ75_01355 [Puniceicoccales bacterium]|jgi:hypothetical protein|nr:hypothetical protein [Puniceicoccales bacterium]
MKKLKFLFWLCAVICLAILSIRVPYVQTYVAKRYLARCFDKVYVDRVSIGISAAKVRNLALSSQNTDLRVADLDIKWSLRDLIFLHELKISEMNMDKVFINYTRPETAAKSGPKVPFVGKDGYKNLQEQLTKFCGVVDFVKSPKFPLRTTIGHMKVNGLLSIDEYIIAEVTLDGGGFAPLSAAIVDIKSDVAIGKTTPTRLNFNGKAKIFQAGNASIEDIDFNCGCELFNPVEQSKKMFNITSLYRVTPSESLYRLHIGGDEGTDALCSAEIKYQKDQQKLFIECEKFPNTPAIGTPILSQIAFNTRWSGEFEFQNWNGLLKGNGSCILGKAGKNFAKTYLPSLKPDVAICGGVVLKMVNGTLVVNSMEATCEDKEDSWKITLSSTNPIVIWNKDAGYLASKNIFNSGKSLCRMTVENFNPKVFSTAKSTGKIDTIISGQFDISSVDGCWIVKSSEESLLKFDALTIIQNSKKYIEKVNVACQAALNLGNTTQLAFNGISISEANGNEIAGGAVSFSFADNKKLNALDCYMVCRLDQLAQISWLTAGTPIKSGICSGHINFTQTSNSTAVQGNLNLRSFLVDDSSVPINGQWIVDFTRANDNIKSSMELDLSGQNDTSVFLTIDTFYANNTSDKPTLKFDLRSNVLSIPDLANLAKVPMGMLATSRDTLSAKTKLIPSAVDQNDVSGQQEQKSLLFKWIRKWLKGDGECFVSIKKLLFPGEGVLDNVECLCYITHDKIDLKTINFLLTESPFDLKATLEYSQDKVQNPYDFALSSTFYMKDIGKICKGVKPSKEAMMEGTGKVDVQLASKGNDEWTAISSGEGTINIECSNGMLHLANFLNQKNRAILGAFEFASGILSQANEHVANANFLMEEFQQLCYDTIKINIYRNKDLDILMNELNILGPTIHINASGSIVHTRHKYFYNSPLSIDLKIGAAGKLGEIFDRLGLITYKPKNSKYMQGPRFNIRGTLIDPDFSDFTKILYPLF